MMVGSLQLMDLQKMVFTIKKNKDFFHHCQNSWEDFIYLVIVTFSALIMFHIAGTS